MSPRIHAPDVGFSVEGPVEFVVVDNACKSLLNNQLNIINDGCLQCNNCARVAMVNVLDEPPKEEICCVGGGVLPRRVKCPFTSALRLMKLSPHFSKNHYKVTLAVWGRAPSARNHFSSSTRASHSSSSPLFCFKQLWKTLYISPKVNTTDVISIWLVKLLLCADNHYINRVLDN